MLFILLLISMMTSCVVSQTCHPFQTFDTPRISPSQNYCKMYQNSTCCDNGTAKRAYNWAYEDDGCGVVHNDCLKLSVDVACFINCSPNMTTIPVETFTGVVQRPLVNYDWLQQIYNACLPYAWCGTSQLLTSTCTFLQKASQSRGSDAITVIKSWDTCTLVSELTIKEFAENILYVAIDYNNTIVNPFREPSSANSINPINFFVILGLFQALMILI
jgi:hypothetical protein